MNLYKKYGAIKKDSGYIFSTYAPGADRVYLLINSKKILMNKIDNNWEIFLDNIVTNTPYLFGVEKNNIIYQKSDPFAAKVISNGKGSLISITTESNYKWVSQKVIKKDNVKICEVFVEILPGLNYKEKVENLIKDLETKDFTHIQIMPIYHFSSIETLGYMSNSYFAPSSKYGEIDDFKYFVDKLHEKNYGIIMDFVLFEFGIDIKGLNNFDGDYLFNRNKNQKHDIYGGYLFDLGKPFVRDFLSSAINYYINEFKIDGFRLDALNEIVFRNKKVKEVYYDELSNLKDILNNIDDCLIIGEYLSIDDLSPVNFEKINYVENAAYMYKINYLFKLNESERFLHKDYLELSGMSNFFNQNKNLVSSIGHDLFLSGKTIKFDTEGFISDDYKIEKQKIKLLMIYAVPGLKMIFKDYNIGFEHTDIVKFFEKFINIFDNNINKNYIDFTITTNNNTVKYTYRYENKTIDIIFNISINFIEIKLPDNLINMDERNKIKQTTLVLKPFSYIIVENKV
jgi:1,4-alpha-glucan branching enzyme